MVYHNFTEIKDGMCGGRACKAAIAAAEDETVIRAATALRGEGIVQSILIGDQNSIKQMLKEQGEDPGGYEMIGARDAAGAAKAAAACVASGDAQFIMKGRVDTSVLLKEVVSKEAGLRTGRLMTHLAFMQIPNYHKLIVLTDSGMVISPSLDEKRAIIENAVMTLRDMGYESPKVGVLSAVEKVNPKMPDTVDAAALKEQNCLGIIKNCTVEGPLSYDLLMSRESAKKKGFESEVVGDADIMVVPDMAVGNILGKCLVFSANTRMAGLVVGAKVPIALSSRGAQFEEKYQSMLLAAASCR